MNISPRAVAPSNGSFSRCSEATACFPLYCVGLSRWAETVIRHSWVISAVRLSYLGYVHAHRYQILLGTETWRFVCGLGKLGCNLVYQL